MKKSVIVSGRSGGLGGRMVKRLGEEGDKVVIKYEKRREGGEEVVDEIGSDE